MPKYISAIVSEAVDAISDPFDAYPNGCRRFNTDLDSVAANFQNAIHGVPVCFRRCSVCLTKLSSSVSTNRYAAGS